MPPLTEQQLRAQYAKNSAQLSRMAEKAHGTRKKVNGYTEEQLCAKAREYYLRSIGEWKGKAQTYVRENAFTMKFEAFTYPDGIIQTFATDAEAMAFANARNA